MGGFVDAPPVVLRAHEQVRDELRRADTKATTLLSVVGVALAGVIALGKAGMPAPALAALWLAALPIFGAVLVLLATIRPKLSQFPTPGSWLDATLHGPGVLLEAGSYAAEVAANDVCLLGHLAVAKHTRVKHAVNLLIVGGTVLAVALVLSVLG
ncbi:Pycsar system effector family protein [Amycolatopsis sp.]|uniref:Pycsar system effector family protein n=1 Tax=Amycolatopsis sp. TaxID=37632 RepID=UPI002BFBDEDE|nr:Pycsar system effector family protein [Amycolatopsis sp.]HVV10549.1 Pycsar system effector family protein [Amycolatopsis sp.]